MILRPYQKQLIKDLYRKLYNQTKCLVVAPTGSGKTAITSFVIQDACAKSRKCWFIVHRDELVTQTMETMVRVGLRGKIGVIKAGYKPEPSADIQIVSAQTLPYRKIEPPKGCLVVIDEAHTTSHFKAVMKIITECKGFVVGVTATPWRSNKREGLADHFGGNCVIAPSTKELIDMGYLAPAKFFGFEETFDLRTVKTKMGDFATEELAKQCDNDEANKLVIDQTLKHMDGRTGIAFCVTVKHAMSLSTAFQTAGIESRVVTGTTSKEERAEIYRDLASGKIEMLCSVGVLTEGFDVPSISVCVMARPTKSRALNVQMVGRVLRPSKGKSHAIVLDFAGNHARHGLATEITREEMEPDWIDTSPKGEAPTKECKECNTVLPASATECECGYVFPVKERERETISGQLVDITETQAKGGNPMVKRAYGEAMRKAMVSGYAPTYAKMQVKMQFKRFPTKAEQWQSAFDGDSGFKKPFWEYLKTKVGAEKATKFFAYEYGNIKEG